MNFSDAIRNIKIQAQSRIAALEAERDRMRYALSGIEARLLAAKHRNFLSGSGEEMLALVSAALAQTQAAESK